MRNQGLYHERIQHSKRERAFAETWEELNEPRPYINFGNGILQDLFMEVDPRFGRIGAFCKHEVTESDRFVVATVIQWLGSNVGYSFLDSALKKCGLRIVPEEKETK